MQYFYTVMSTYCKTFQIFCTPLFHLNFSTSTGMSSMPEHQQLQQLKKPATTFQKRSTPTNLAHVSNPAAIIQRAKINPKSLTHADVMQLQRTIGNRAVGRLLSSIGSSSTYQQATIQRQEIPEEEEPLQGKLERIPDQATCPSCWTTPILQKQEISEEEPLQAKRENNTGMPDNLKAGVESLSGIDMNDVKVHYNSSKPAEIAALAYTQGTDIHVAPGKERHLPHEAWHVVQQKQGRVQPTTQLKEGVPINDNTGLEFEADVMGVKAAQTKIPNKSTNGYPAVQRKDDLEKLKKVLQLKAGSSVAQMKLQIESEDAGYKDGVFASIQNLTSDNAVVSMHETEIIDDVRLGGEEAVAHVSTPQNEGGLGKPRSMMLVRRLIESPRVTRVTPTDLGPSAKPEIPDHPRYHRPPRTWRNLWGLLGPSENTLEQRRARDTLTSASTPGLGANANVSFNPEQQLTSLNLAQGADSVRSTEEVLPTHIGLAHELIHADRFSRGHAAFGDNGNGVIAPFREKAKFLTYYGRVKNTDLLKEDIYTVGLPPTPAGFNELYYPNLDEYHLGEPGTRYTDPNDPDAIIEQDIRDEHRVHRRATY